MAAIFEEDKCMKILVTGGCGFIGCAFVRYLMEHTQAEVINLDKLSYASNTACNVYSAMAPRYRFYQVDLLEKEKLTEIITAEQPTHVINIAAETHVDRSIDGPHEFFNSNITGVYNLLQTVMAYWQGLPQVEKERFRYHQVSTDEVYGELKSDLELPFTESSTIKPSSPYSASKASGDALVQAWNKTYGLPTLITRAANNYGPWQYLEKLIPVVIDCILKRKPIPIYGTGLQKRNWLHVDDHVQALYQVLTMGEPGAVYNIGSEDELANIELVKKLCLLASEQLKISEEVPLSLITHIADRQGHDFRYALSSAKLTSELGWKPQIALNDGLRDTVAWYINRHADS